MAIVDFDSNGHVRVPELSLYNDIKYLKEMQYEGKINNVEGVHYTVGKKGSREDLYTAVLNRLKKNVN